MRVPPTPSQQPPLHTVMLGRANVEHREGRPRHALASEDQSTQSLGKCQSNPIMRELFPQHKYSRKRLWVNMLSLRARMEIWGKD